MLDRTVQINESVKLASSLSMDCDEARMARTIKALASLIAESGNHDYGDFRRTCSEVVRQCKVIERCATNLLLRY
ncbi:hypothetical protein LCGC14_1390970 [marine sediment metagenome]|uniref:Uncharacterized protein n=1 Tax=marine sediment metagenome TaxID=412755 RepID=A0A0F9K009_9ZZZZ